ncbi:MAG: thioredoxin family protein [Candidatus Riflebacteria bacterium]|nr:thioredoxin family protein [Candidatus Riflebacteria bacterium]
MSTRFAWPLVALGALVLFAAGCGSSGGTFEDHTQGLPFVFGYDKGLEAAKAQGKPTMMFVTTTWCGWCKKLARENFTDPRIKGLLKNFVLVIVDGDKEKEGKARLKADQGYPHIVFLSRSGEKVAECVGYRPVDKFTPIVQEAVQRVGGK